MNRSILASCIIGIAVLSVTYLRWFAPDKSALAAHDHRPSAGIAGSAPREPPATHPAYAQPSLLPADETTYYLTVHQTHQSQFLPYLLGASLSAAEAGQALHNHTQKGLTVRSFVEVVDNDRPLPLSAVHEVQRQIEIDFEQKLIREIGEQKTAWAAEVFHADYFVNMLNLGIRLYDPPQELWVSDRMRYILATTLMRTTEEFSEARGIAAVSRLEYDDEFRADVYETTLSVVINDLSPAEYRGAEQLLHSIQVRAQRSGP